MASLALFLLCFAPSSDVGAPPADFALNLRLASATTHAPLSSQWAMSYYQTPRLIGTPAPVDEPTMGPVTQPISEFSPIGPEPNEGDAGLIWHDWSMKDMSLEWGLATIGPGVLAPQSGAVSGRPAGGAPGGGGGQPRQQSPTFIFTPPPNTGPTPSPGPGENVQPVPEANAMFLWLVLVSTMILCVNHLNKPPAVSPSPVPA